MSKRQREQRKQEQKRLLRMRIAASLVVMVIVLALGTVGIWWIGRQANAPGAREPLPAQSTVDDAWAMYQDGALIVDVRTDEEYEAFHIPESLLIPLDELEEQLEFIPMNLDLVVICRTGNRSIVGRDILLEAGFPRVTSVDGGVVEWGEAGYPLEGRDL